MEDDLVVETDVDDGNTKKRDKKDVEGEKRHGVLKRGK